MKKALGQNTIYFTSALIIQKILSFFYFWYISNQLQPNDLGRYIFVLSYVAIFSIIPDLGLNTLFIRESSKKPEMTNRYLRNIMGLKIVLLLITYISLFAIISLSAKSHEVKMLIYLGSVIMLFDTFTLTFWSIF